MHARCAKSYAHFAPISCPSCFGFGEMGFGPVCAKKLGLTPPKKAKTAKVIPFPIVA